MRVLHLTPTYFSKDSITGGAERYVDELAKNMAKSETVSVLSFGERTHHFSRHNVTYYIEKSPLLIDGNLLNPFPKGLIKQFLKHDIIHIHQVYNILAEAGIILAKLLARPVFLTDHGGGGRTFLTRMGLPSQADGLLTVSRYNMNRLPFKGTKISPIWGGVDLERFTLNNEENKRIEGHLCILGRILPHKGHHHLIQALKETSYSLSIIGRAHDQNYLQYLKDLSHEQDCKFYHDLNDEEVVSELGQASLAVFPSTRKGPFNEELEGEPELFGIAPLECMATGLPTLVSDVGSYPEIAFPHSNFIFEQGNIESLKNSIQNIFSNPEINNIPPRKWRTHVEKYFTWDKTTLRCIKRYQESLA